MTSLKIQTQENVIELLPAPRDRLPKLRRQLVRLGSHWLRFEFAVGDCLLDKKCWGDMEAAIALLPWKDNPAIAWDGLDLLSNDYAQLEKIFFAREKEITWVTGENGGFYKFEANKFKPGLITELHLFNPMGILQDAQRSLMEG